MPTSLPDLAGASSASAWSEPSLAAPLSPSLSIARRPTAARAAPFAPPIPPELSVQDPADLAASLAQADAAVVMADWPAALAGYERAIAAAPLACQPYLGLVRVFEAWGRGQDALACRAAALALEAGTALDLYNLGTAYLMNGHGLAAAAWYRLALLRDPALVVAHRNLAAVLRDLGRDAEAQVHQEAAYRRQHCFDDQRDAPAVLLICAAGRGNVPLDLWFPPAAWRRIEYMIEYAGEADDRLLVEAIPPATVCFNAIGDADVLAPIQARVEHMEGLLRQRMGLPDAPNKAPHRGLRASQPSALPLMNSPAAVARSARNRLATTLAGLDHVVVPPTHRVERAGLVSALRAAHADAPHASWLVRPVASHGGQGLRRIEPEQVGDFALESDTTQSWYLTRYVDTRGTDGLYRKYRVVLIDGVPFPYHLAISSHWLVHYFSADMLASSAKQAEEARFLERPEAVLGQRALAALAEIGARLGLQYAGIDFTLLPDGKVLVFEANATMLVHRETPGSALDYKNRYVERMRDAFELMQRRYTLLSAPK